MKRIVCSLRDSLPRLYSFFIGIALAAFWVDAQLRQASVANKTSAIAAFRHQSGSA